MSYVVSQELRRELYELSNWDDDEVGYSHFEECPLYSLGYLLRKLPPSVLHEGHPYLLSIHPNYSGSSWSAHYSDPDTNTCFIQVFADTPEDAAAKLAIELFEQKILTKDEA